MNYETLSKLEAQVWVLRKIAPYDDELEKLKSRIYKIRDKFVNRVKDVSLSNDYELELLKNEALELEKIFYVTFNYRKTILDNEKSLLQDLYLNEVYLEPFDYNLKKAQEKNDFRIFDEEYKKNNSVSNLHYSQDARKWLDEFYKKISKINDMEKSEVISLITELRKFEASMYREEYYLEDFQDEINHIRQRLNSRLTIQNRKTESLKKNNFEDEDSFIKKNPPFSLSEEPKIQHKTYNVSQNDYVTPQVDGFYERLRKK